MYNKQLFRAPQSDLKTAPSYRLKLSNCFLGVLKPDLTSTGDVKFGNFNIIISTNKRIKVIEQRK